jgi:hypothetical protein
MRSIVILAYSQKGGVDHGSTQQSIPNHEHHHCERASFPVERSLVLLHPTG